MFIIGRLMGVSTVLLTTGTSGRDDLFKKFTEMLQGSNLPSPWAQGYVHPDIEFAYGVGQNTAIPQKRSFYFPGPSYHEILLL